MCSALCSDVLELTSIVPLCTCVSSVFCLCCFNCFKVLKSLPYQVPVKRYTNIESLRCHAMKYYDGHTFCLFTLHLVSCLQSWVHVRLVVTEHCTQYIVV